VQPIILLGFFVEQHIDMWQELLIAIALMLVIEGILPFLSPHTMRSVLLKMLEMDDKSLRISGLMSMVIGVILLYVIH